MKCQDVYYDEPQIFEFPNMTVRVYRPILTDEERERRMKEIKKAAAAVIIARDKALRRGNA